MLFFTGIGNERGGSYYFSNAANSEERPISFSSVPTKTASAFSVLVWVNYEAAQNALGVTIGGDHFVLGFCGSTCVRLTMESPAGNTDFDKVSYELWESKWNHIAATFDNTTGFVRLWINDKLSLNETWKVTGVKTFESEVILGGRNNSMSSFVGRMACFQIFNQSLNEIQVKRAKYSCVKERSKRKSV